MDKSIGILKHVKPQHYLGFTNMSSHNQSPRDQPALPDMSVSREYLHFLFGQLFAEISTSVRQIVREEMNNLAGALTAGQQQGNSGHEPADPHANYTASQERDGHLQAIEGHIEQIQSLREQLDKTVSDLAQEKQKLGKLRGMLVKESPNYVLDSVAIHNFVSLRSQIFKFVKSTFDMQRPLAKLVDKELKEIYGPYKIEARREKYLVNRVCSLVFDLLSRSILSQPFFGPGGSPALDKFQSALARVEYSFLRNLPKKNLKEFVDWREASIKCGSFFPTKRDIVDNAASIIWSYLTPMTMKQGVEKKGQQLLLGLCSDALILNADLRNSRDVFEIRGGFQGPLEGHLDYAEELTSEELSEHAKDFRKPEDIAFCTFGALVKRTEEDPTKDIVLEKAQVVVYRG
ncbi:hypothetical protein F5Y13DRAFT_176921 [Hypoxylon sp. FL1857]|nr:hypothetical protein F5Y13DRAFT_176921 [Hypoxylon sp. FL1857]